MAETSVFLSGDGDGAGVGVKDLLQQAFQEIVDENEQFDYLMRSVTDSSEPMLHLTAEQIAALGITFKVEEPDQQHQELQEQNQEMVEMQQEQTIMQSPQYQQQSSPEQQQRNLEFSMESGGSDIQQQGFFSELTQADSESIVTDDINQWFVQQQEQQGSLQQQVQEPQQNKENHQQGPLHSNIMIEVLSPEQNVVNQQTNVVQEQKVPNSMESQCNQNVLQNAFQISIASNNAQGDSPELQAQKVQRYHTILPSAQYIIKTAQPLYTPMKNIRVVPTNSVKVSSNQSSQNSLLLPKTTMINSGSPQIIKAVSLGTQFLSTNNVPMQLINTSPTIITKTTNSINNHLVKGSLNTTANTSNMSKQNVILQSSVQKTQTGQTQIRQNGNLQQFFAPTIKVSANGTLKNTSLLNNTINKQNAAPILKYQTQTLKAAYIKKPSTSQITARNTNLPVILRTTPVVKTDNSKPVSILKPQLKATSSPLIKQNHQNTYVVQKNSLIKSNEVTNCTKPLITAKMKQNVNSLLTNLQKKTIPFVTKDHQELVDTNRIYKATENGIQLVQQGQPLPSQLLSPTQLKYINQTLQQKNQTLVINQRNQAQSSNQKTQAQILNNQRNLIQVINQKNQSNGEYTVYTLVVNGNDINNPNSLLKRGKRGRPKKSDVKSPTSGKSADEQQPQQQEDAKDERKKIVARTRSGRVSRPPRHMLQDYKHLHRSDFTQPDLDDSDGGYVDYTANGSDVKADEVEGSPQTELLTGLVLPKRKISDQFKCPTCCKTYLGRIKMARHFELNPDHGSPDQLPPPSAEPEPQDPLKRKGKKRGLHVYTPEQKAKRRCTMLRETMKACTNEEIVKVTGEKVASSMSVFDFLVKKSQNNVRAFLTELKELGDCIRQKASTMLSVANNEEKHNDDVVDLNDEVLCDMLALNSGFYKINEPLYEEKKTDEGEEKNSGKTLEMDSNEELSSQAVPKMEIENINQVKMENVERAFIKLEPMQDGGFIKLGNGIIGSFHQDIRELGKLQNNAFQCVSDGTSGSFNETNGFKKLEPEINRSKSHSPFADDIINDRNSQIDQENSIQITTNGSNNGNSNIFSNNEVNYDHINLLNTDNVNKNLILDQLVDPANMVDEIVSEKLKMMQDNLLDSNLLQGNNHLDAQLDFEDFSEEFDRNTRS